MIDLFPRWWAFCQLPENDGHADDTAADGAGLTRYGWTYPTWRQATAYDDGHNLSRAAFDAMASDEAMVLAQAWFWQRLRADEMQAGTNISVVDWAFTSGGAIHEIQHLLNVPADGIVGPCTLEALDGSPPPALIYAIYIHRLDFYASLGLRPRFPGLWTRAAACRALSLASVDA